MVSQPSVFKPLKFYCIYSLLLLKFTNRGLIELTRILKKKSEIQGLYLSNLPHPNNGANALRCIATIFTEEMTKSTVKYFYLVVTEFLCYSW